MAKKEMKKDVSEIKKEEYYNFDFHNTLKNMYLHPTNFFKEKEQENSYQILLRTFVLFYIFYLLIVSIIGLILKQINLIQFLTNFVVGVVFSVFLIFVFSGMMHFILILTATKGSYFNTYKASIYTLIIWVFYSIILSIISIFLPFDTLGFQLFLTNIAGQGYTEIIKASLTFLKDNLQSLLSIIISLVFYTHIIVFGIMALKYFQKLSKIKASVIVILTTILLFLAQVLVISYIVSKTNLAS